jgi:hypothetical protein
MTADFDWVKARSECSLAVIFERLKVQLQQDVETRQSLRGPGPFYEYGFKLVIEGRSVAVVLEGARALHDSVLFRLTETAIEITDRNGQVTLSATPTVSDDGECRLKVDGQERELWQVRKLALEPMFFSENTR